MGRGTLLVKNETTGLEYRLKLEDNCLKAVDLKQITDSSGRAIQSFDVGYMNTVCCRSKICYIDGDKGILEYRGYPIKSLCGEIGPFSGLSYEALAFLLIYGNLPTDSKLSVFTAKIKEYTVLPQSVKDLISTFSRDAHPMSILTACFAALGACFPKANPAIMGTSVYSSGQLRDVQIARVLGLMPLICANIYRHSNGLLLLDSIVTEHSSSYAESFLRGCGFDVHAGNPKIVRAMEILLILHMEHELNCSTAALLHVSSANADVYTAISAAVGALYGPSHGGANEAVIRMLQKLASGKSVEAFVADVKARKEKLMGFGHRIYKTYDPRARLVRSVLDHVMTSTKLNPLTPLAIQLESIALKDEFFVSRKLYPNVDFYSGLIYQLLGFKPDFFTVLFALGRIAGWLAHWNEYQDDPERRIVRPFQKYEGCRDRSLLITQKAKL